MGDAVDELKRLLSVADAARREQLRALITAALQARLGEISEKATGEVYFSVSYLGAEVKPIDAFSAKKAESVEPGQISASSAEFVAKVAGELKCTLSFMPGAPGPLRLSTPYLLGRKVGQPPPISSFALSIVGTQTETRAVDVSLVVEGEAILEANRVTAIRLTSLLQEMDITFAPPR